MTVFLTIISGVSVYIVGQIIIKFVIDPFHAQRETIGKVVDFLIVHANIYTNPGIHQEAGLLDEEYERSRRAQLYETRTTARALASEIIVKTQAVPLYGLLERFGWAIQRKNIRIAQENLFSISNALFDVGHALENYRKAQRIEDALGVVTEFQIDEELEPEGDEAGEGHVGD